MILNKLYHLEEKTLGNTHGFLKIKYCQMNLIPSCDRMTAWDIEGSDRHNLFRLYQGVIKTSLKYWLINKLNYVDTTAKLLPSEAAGNGQFQVVVTHGSMSSYSDTKYLPNSRGEHFALCLEYGHSGILGSCDTSPKLLKDWRNLKYYH